MCVCVSEGVQGAHLKTVLLDFCQTGPVDPDFLCQEQSLNPYGSFEQKTDSLDLSFQKLRVLLDLMYSPFLFSFIVLEIMYTTQVCVNEGGLQVIDTSQKL